MLLDTKLTKSSLSNSESILYLLTLSSDSDIIEFGECCFMCVMFPPSNDMKISKSLPKANRGTPRDGIEM